MKTSSPAAPRAKSPTSYPKGSHQIENARPDVRGLGHGTRVRIRKGEAAQTDDRSHRNVAGVVGRVMDDPYVSQGGPNKGKTIQVVKDETTGECLGVPIERLERESGSSRSSLGYSRKYAEAYERAFGKK